MAPHTEESMKELCQYMEHANIDVDVAEKDLGLPEKALNKDIRHAGPVRCTLCECWEQAETVKKGLCPDCFEASKPRKAKK